MLSSRCAATAEEKFALLNCRRLPDRVNTSEAALLLGFQEHDIALLVAANCWCPLGNSWQNIGFEKISESQRMRDRVLNSLLSDR
jgi:hypothetical protein